MELDFGVRDISIVSLGLPLAEELYQKYQTLLPFELTHAAQTRKEDFLAGRICAFRAAKLLGENLTELPRSNDRSPIWPKNLKGSIGHSKKIAVSCVTSSKKYLSVGIDVEELIPNTMDIKYLVANDKEVNLLKKDFQLGLTVLFSAKEALYKALHPLLKKYIDFKEVELTSWCDENQVFEIMPLTEDVISLGLAPIKGSYKKINNTIVTLIYFYNLEAIDVNT